MNVLTKGPMCIIGLTGWRQLGQAQVRWIERNRLDFSRGERRRAVARTDAISAKAIAIQDDKKQTEQPSCCCSGSKMEAPRAVSYVTRRARRRFARF